MKLTLIFQEATSWMPATIWAIPSKFMTKLVDRVLTDLGSHSEEVDVEVWTVKNLLYANYPYYLTWCWPMLDGRLYKLDSVVASSVYTYFGAKMDTHTFDRVGQSSASNHPFFNKAKDEV